MTEHQAQVEEAVQADLRNYRKRQILKAVLAAVLIGIGTYLGLARGGGVPPWLSRKLDPGAAQTLRNLGLGPYLVAGGVLWMVHALNALLAGSLLRRAERTRRRLMQQR